MKKRIVAALLCAGLMAAAPVMDILPAATVQAAEEADLTDGAINSLEDLKAASGTGGSYLLEESLYIDGGEKITLENVTLRFSGGALQVYMSEEPDRLETAATLYVRSGSCLTLGAGVTLALDNPNTDFGSVYLAGGTLTQQAGAVLDGVFVQLTDTFEERSAPAQSRFIMNGGTIRNVPAEEGKDDLVSGCGVCNYGGEVSLSGGEIVQCDSVGVFQTAGSLKMTDGEIRENSEGGVLLTGGSFGMQAGQIAGNGSVANIGSMGGGVALAASDGKSLTFRIEGGEISGKFGETGGGVSLRAQTEGRVNFTMTAGEIFGNTAGQLGGGIGFLPEKKGYGELTISGGRICGNQSLRGGGAAIFSDPASLEETWAGCCTLTVTGGEISGNVSFLGGGVFANGGVFRMTGGSITGNTVRQLDDAGEMGELLSRPVALNYGGELALEGGEISGNTAPAGAGIGAMTLVNAENPEQTLPPRILLSGEEVSLEDPVYLEGMNISTDTLLYDERDPDRLLLDPVTIEISREWLEALTAQMAMSLFETESFDQERVDYGVAELLNRLIRTPDGDLTGRVRFRIVDAGTGETLGCPVLEQREVDGETCWVFKWDGDNPGEFAYTVDYTELDALCAEIISSLEAAGLTEIPPELAEAFRLIDWNIEDTPEGREKLQSIIGALREAYRQWLGLPEEDGEQPQPAEEEEAPALPEAALSDGWHHYPSGSMYYRDGKRTRGWAEIDGKTFYFDSTGYMAAGWTELEDGWRYFGEDGQMRTGWLQIGNVWYYLAPETGVMTDGGLRTIGKSTYYFHDWGGMASDWWYEAEDGWYYFGGSGAMKAAQWLRWNGDWYYLTETGRMAADTEIAGYYVNGDGVWAG